MNKRRRFKAKRRRAARQRACKCVICMHRLERDELCKALEQVLGISSIYLTDMSAMSDFAPELSELVELRDVLCVPVARDDYVGDVLVRMRKNRS